MNQLLLWISVLGIASSLLFSTLSYALRIMSRVALEENLDRRRRSAALDAILHSRHDLALTSSIVRLLSNIVVIVAIGFYFQRRFAGVDETTLDYAWKVFGMAALVSTPLLMIFSVAIPQAWAKYSGEALIAGTWPLIRGLRWLLYPLIYVMNVLDEMVRRLAGVTLEDDADAEADHVEQEIMAVISEGTADGTVDEEQKKMIEGVISFRDLQVGQIMTPRTDIAAIEAPATLAEVRDLITREGVSRLPVFEGNLDNIIGVLYAKDLLAGLGSNGNNNFDVKKFLRPPLFVPATKPLRDLLKELRLQQVHIAIVLDEYGGTSGLVTTEDIVEEIVGDIADEYELPEPNGIKRIDERTVEVDARMNIVEINRELDLDLPEHDDYHTLGGFVIATLGTIPPKGETLRHAGIEMIVLDSEPRRVKRVKMILPDEHSEMTEDARDEAQV